MNQNKYNNILNMDIQLYNYKKDVEVEYDINHRIKYFNLIKTISKDEVRTTKILDLIQKDQKILIICKLIDQAISLVNSLKERNFDVEIFRLGVRNFPTSQIIVSTIHIYDMYNIGLDLKIDTLISTFTMKNYTSHNIALVNKTRALHYIQICDLGNLHLKKINRELKETLKEYKFQETDL